MLHAFYKDVFKYLPARVLPALVAVLAIPICTRLFPPHEYGLYILVMTTVLVLGTLVDWLGMAIIRFHPACEREGRMQELHSTVLIALPLSLAPLLLLALVAWFLLRTHMEPMLAALFRVGMLYFLVGTSTEVVFNFLRARRRIAWYGALTLWKSVAGLAFGVALVIFFDFGITGLLWGHVLASAATLPFAWRLCCKPLTAKAFRPTLALARTMAGYSMPLVAGNVALWVLALSDRYVIEYFHGSQAVGIYGVSYSLTEKTVLFLAALFRTASAPLEMATWENEGAQKSGELVARITRTYLLLAIPIVVLLSVFAQPIVMLLTTAPYHDGYRLVPFVAAAIFLGGLEERFESGLLYQKKTRVIMRFVLLAGLSNIALNFAFVPRYGYMAAAITTLCCYAGLFCAIALASRRHFVWKFPLMTLARSSGAAFFMLLPLPAFASFTPTVPALQLLMTFALAASIYLAAILFLGEIKLRDLRGVVSLKK